ncbi:MAG: hypothetical protein KY439_11925 [Actinobacteria bacterium]|nr:hypothetical protein [Actinomycetota bacterium]
MARRIGLTITGALVALLVFAGGASSQVQYPPQGSNLQADKTEVGPGGSMTVSGAGFAAASTVTVTFDDAVVLGITHVRGKAEPTAVRSAKVVAVVLGTTQVREDGTFSIDVTIPRTASPGRHTLAATGTGADGTPRRLTFTVDVRGVSLARGDTLPRTGSGVTAPLVATAVLLIGAGSVAVVATRRRSA